MIKLYTTETCSRCDILKNKLLEKGIEFEIGNNEEIIAEGFRTVPILNIDGGFLDFGKAVAWINDM